MDALDASDATQYPCLVAQLNTTKNGMPRMNSNAVCAPRPLSKNQIAEIGRIIASGGSSRLPQAPPGSVWCLVDSGAEPHAAPHKKMFKNAPISSDGSSDTYAAANGSQISSGGKFNIDCSTQEGHDWTVSFRDADVAFPILSTGRLTDQGNYVLYHKTGGAIIDVQTGQRSEFVRALGVYWILLSVDPAILTEPNHVGFGQQG